MKRPIHSFFVFVVLLGHLLALFFLMKPVTENQVRTKALVVRMKEVASPAVHQKVAAPPKSVPKKVKAPTPPPKKEELPKPTPLKNPAPQKSKPVPEKKKTPAPSKPKPLISQELLDELEESIAKIDEKRDKDSNKSKKTTSQLDVPRVQASVPVEEAATQTEERLEFQEKLIACLHSALHLPDHGEVTIVLTLRSNGSVTKMFVKKTQSKKNQTYLEAQLPFVRFPLFEGALSGKKEETFTITFCNEI